MFSDDIGHRLPMLEVEVVYISATMQIEHHGLGVVSSRHFKHLHTANPIFCHLYRLQRLRKWLRMHA